MRFAFLTAGTRGDTQPYVALASELVSRGHQVVIAASEDLSAFVSRAGLESVPYTGIRTRELLDEPRGKEFLARGQLMKFLSWMRASQKQHEKAIVAGMAQAVEGADVIVPHIIVEAGAQALAQWKKVPLIRTHLAPITPTRAFPSPMLDIGRIHWEFLRPWTYRLVRTLAWSTERSGHRSVCRKLGIQPISQNPYVLLERELVPCAHMVSPTLLPPPADWGSHHVVTGHCNLPGPVRERVGEGPVDPALDRWLLSGEPPIYFGFGSMPILNPPEFLRTVRQVLESLGMRGLIVSGWTNMQGMQSDERIFLAPELNHDAVLPRCRAAVHHGGVGTTTASLAAGLPTLICSVFLDQPFWGTRVQALGAGTWMPFRRLTLDRLREGLELLLSEPVQARARELGERMRQERGLRNTADFLEETAGQLVRVRRRGQPQLLAGLTANCQH